VQKQIGALEISDDISFPTRHRAQILTLAARHAVPVIYPNRIWVEAGGLMSYGANQTDAYRQTGAYAGRILKGEKPANLPIMRAVKIEFVANLVTARAIGVEFPATLRALADEVIE
jgi:putative ABC transport system substrate-binding protein